MDMEEEHEEEERRVDGAEPRGEASGGAPDAAAQHEISRCEQCSPLRTRAPCRLSSRWLLMQQSEPTCPMHSSSHDQSKAQCAAGAPRFITLLLLHRQQNQVPHCCDRPEPSARGSSVRGQLEVAAAGGRGRT